VFIHKEDLDAHAANIFISIEDFVFSVVNKMNITIYFPLQLQEISRISF